MWFFWLEKTAKLEPLHRYSIREASVQKRLLVLGGVVGILYLAYEQGIGTDSPDGGTTDAGTIDDLVALVMVPDYINAWADAITVHEGWYPGSRSYRNNNPGNLEIDGDAGRDSGGYGVFSSYSAGRNALVADLSAKVRKYRSWTLYQVMSRYAPPSENNTTAYTNAVAAALGGSVTPSTLVSQISSDWSGSYSPLAFGSSATATVSSPAPSATDNSGDAGSSSIGDLLLNDSTGTALDLSGFDLTGIDS
jgi:hypothetical protein